MGNEDLLDDIIESRSGSPRLSRREFGALALGAGLGSALAPVVGATDMRESEVDITTPDGTADA